MLNEFKKFAMKGNVIDLAVGVIIGSAFGKIVSSLVDDIIMPIIGLIIGGVDLSKLTYTIIGTEVVVKYGEFLQSVTNFLIIAFSIFLFIKLLTRFKKKEEVKNEKVLIDKKEELLMEIRDLMKQRENNF